MVCVQIHWEINLFILFVFVGTGIVTRDELSSFYSSVLGLNAVKVGEILDIAYQTMTSVSFEFAFSVLFITAYKPKLVLLKLMSI